MARYFDNPDEFYVVLCHTEWDYKEAHEVTYYKGTSYEFTQQIPERQPGSATAYYGPYSKAGASLAKSYFEKSYARWDDGQSRRSWTIHQGKVEWSEVE